MSESYQEAKRRVKREGKQNVWLKFTSGLDSFEGVQIELSSQPPLKPGVSRNMAQMTALMAMKMVSEALNQMKAQEKKGLPENREAEGV